MSNMTNGQLKAMFRDLDETFFGGELHSWHVRWAILDPRQFGFCDPDARAILVALDHKPSDPDLFLILLHEMAHAITQDMSHDRPWQRAMQELLRQGAPIEESHIIDCAHRDGLEYVRRVLTQPPPRPPNAHE